MTGCSAALWEAGMNSEKVKRNTCYYNSRNIFCKLLQFRFCCMLHFLMNSPGLKKLLLFLELSLEY